MRDQLPQSDGAGDQWMYSVDTSLSMPYQEKLVTLLNTEGFQNRRQGNPQASEFYPCPRQQCRPQYPRHQQGAARYALENLFVFLDFVDYCYGKGDEEREFDSSLLEQEQAAPSSVQADAADVTIEQLKAETRHCGNSSRKARPPEADVCSEAAGSL